MTTTCPGFNAGVRKCSMQVSKTSLVLEPSTAIEGPTPSQPMLATRVVLLPLFPGHLEEGSLAAGRVSVQRGKRGVGTHSAHERKPSAVELADRGAQRRPPVAYARSCPDLSFFGCTPGAC